MHLLFDESFDRVVRRAEKEEGRRNDDESDLLGAVTKQKASAAACTPALAELRTIMTMYSPRLLRTEARKR